METNSNHSANNGANSAEKMVNDSTKELTDFYTKQLNVATGFYKNLFDSFSTGNKGWNAKPDFSNGFTNNDFAKAFTMPFNGIPSNFTNPFLPMFDNLYKQMVDYNTTMFANITNSLKANADMPEISKKYQDTVNTRMEASKNILKSAAEAYNKQLDFSIENNKKAMDEITNQFNSMLTQNQKFWSDLLASMHGSTKNEEKIAKDTITPEIKKRTSVPANELSDHKA